MTACFAVAVLGCAQLLLACLVGLQVAGLHELLSAEADNELAAMAEEELGTLQTQVGGLTLAAL
jgi:hypothetical protein